MLAFDSFDFLSLRLLELIINKVMTDYTMSRSKINHSLANEYNNDFHSRQSREQGFKSRAVFKLKAIQDKDRLFFPGQNVIDLGAAPGGWSELAADLVGPNGSVFALDRSDMVEIPGVTKVVGDFEDASIRQSLLNKLNGSGIDIVMSDMSPNLTGHRAIDQTASMHLCELAVEFCRDCLKSGGSFLVKVFQGDGSEQFKRILGECFSQVSVRKPQASRARSREVYFLARGYCKLDINSVLR